jgi:hypothetical protein
MFELREYSAFKHHLRDLLVQAKGFASQDNAELFADEVLQQQVRQAGWGAALPRRSSAPPRWGCCVWGAAAAGRRGCPRCARTLQPAACAWGAAWLAPLL